MDIYTNECSINNFIILINNHLMSYEKYDVIKLKLLYI